MKRRNLFFILTSLICILLPSCTTEEEELLLQSSGNGSFSTLGTINNTARLTVYSDNYGPLLPLNTDIFLQNKANTYGQRVLLELLFTDNTERLDNKHLKEVEVLSLYKVLTKDADIIQTATSDANVNDTFGIAPISITSTTISPEHLNIQYAIEGNDKTISHRISLLVSENAQPDENGLLNVELRHNPETDSLLNSFWGVVSFTLSSIPQCQSTNFKGFRILYKKEDGSKTFTTVSN